MATPRRTPRRHFKNGPSSTDRILRLNFMHRAGFLGSKLLGRPERYLVIPEPAEELEGSELSDNERQQAILREKTRREGHD